VDGSIIGIREGCFKRKEGRKKDVDENELKD